VTPVEVTTQPQLNVLPLIVNGPGLNEPEYPDIDVEDVLTSAPQPVGSVT
jgi:hypothetical protein